MPNYVLLIVKTEKSLRNVINQSPHACAHINGDKKGKIPKNGFHRMQPNSQIAKLAKYWDTVCQ